jgi:hypothetical protein
LQRRLLTLAAGAGVAVVAGALFVLTYDDLRALALAGRAAERLASAYPVMYDALVVVTILSLVVARHARWWSRWVRWLLLFLLVGGGAAASVQRAVKGYGPLPDQGLAAGVAGAPHAMLVIALLLWLGMFRHARSSPRGRRPGEGPESEPAPEQAGVPAETVPMTAGRLMLESPDAPAHDRPADDLVPGMAEVTQPSPRRKGQGQRDQAPLRERSDPRERPDQGEQGPQPPREGHGTQPWLDAGEPRPAVQGPAEQPMIGPPPAEPRPIEQRPIVPEPRPPEPAPTAVDPDQPDQPDQPDSAEPERAEPVQAETDREEPGRAEAVREEPDQVEADQERETAPEAAIDPAAADVPEAGDPATQDPEDPDAEDPDAEDPDAEDPDAEGDTGPDVGLVHEEERPHRAPASLPTDVKLVGRPPAGLAATTLPDGIRVAAPDPAEDDIDASVADRAEDPDAGDESAENVEWPPAGKFRSSPTPPTG